MAGAQDWRGLYLQEKIAPLKLIPFLPQDNNDDERLGALRRTTVELGKCLTLPFPAFLSFVLEDSALKNFVDTFLRYSSAWRFASFRHRVLLNPQDAVE